MSFRTAYGDLRNRRSSTRTRGLNQGLLRDRTPEQQQKERDAYAKQVARWEKAEKDKANLA